MNWKDFLTPVLAVFAANVVALRPPSTIIIELLFSLALWMVVRLDMFSHQPLFSIHKSYFFTLNTLIVLGALTTSIVMEKLGTPLSTVYLFAALSILLFDERSARGVGIFLAGMSFLHFGEDIWILLYGVAMSLVASITLRSVYRRVDVLRSALIMSIVNVGIYAAKLLTMFPVGTLEIPLAAFNPFISSIVILGLLPYIEYTSRIYSNIGLIELGNLNHPLLKLLSMKAPGTYQHSSMVANLAEAAAERIGANSLLARVASYYHDIGKVKRPVFFIENQFEGENPHDAISPYLSHLILDEHVKHGVSLARKYRLPIPVECVIAEHHGTRVQRYFYEKAKTIDPKVSEDDFRYPGQKPQFKESGIIMLADAVEAVSRTLKGKSHSQIRSIVEEIVMGIFTEKQLDNSGLTLEDLENIIDEFVRVLMSFYHHRIEYPKETMEVRLLNGIKK